MQIFGKPAHVVMRLYGAAFQNVGINGTLREEFDAVLLSGLLLEHADKLRADDLALLFGLGNAGELIQKPVYRVHIYEVRVHLIPEHLYDLFGFALAQKPVIHVHAHEILSDRLDEERRHDGRIHPAREREQNLFAADLLFDRFDLFRDELVRKLFRCDARHIFGALVAFHRPSS